MNYSMLCYDHLYAKLWICMIDTCIMLEMHHVGNAMMRSYYDYLSVSIECSEMCACVA